MSLPDGGTLLLMLVTWWLAYQTMLGSNIGATSDTTKLLWCFINRETLSTTLVPLLQKEQWLTATVTFTEVFETLGDVSLLYHSLKASGAPL